MKKNNRNANINKKVINESMVTVDDSLKRLSINL